MWEVWEILVKYSDDVGFLGMDMNYGVGVLNLGWVLNMNLVWVDLVVVSYWMEWRDGM